MSIRCYDYKCVDCGSEEEVIFAMQYLMRFHNHRCGDCGGHMDRLFPMPNFNKGHGSLGKPKRVDPEEQGPIAKALGMKPTCDTYQKQYY